MADETKNLEPEPTDEKMVKDSFSIPASDHAILAQLSDRAMGMRIRVTKVRLLRLALHAAREADDETFRRLLRALPELKTGPRSK